MKKIAIIAVISLLSVSILFFASCSSGGKSSAQKAGNHNALLDLINADRVEQGLDPLVMSEPHSEVAQHYAGVIAAPANQTSPPQYRNNLLPGYPQSQLSEKGVTFTTTGETGVVDYPNTIPTESAVFGRLTSSTLRNSSFTRIGIGSRAFACDA